MRNNPDAWALEHWHIKDEPLSFAEHKYLPWIYAQKVPDMAIQKCSQVGVSEYLLVLTVWVAGELGLTVFYLFHAAQSASDFSQERLNPVFEASPYLLRLLKGEMNAQGWARDAGGRWGRRGADRVTLKRIGRGFAYFRPAREKAMTSVASDMVVFDEFDQMWDGAFEFGQKRLGNSKFKWTRRVSVPSIPDFGINAAFNEGTQHVWKVRCEGCGDWQEMTWFGNIVEDLGDERYALKSPRAPIWIGMPKEEIPKTIDVICRKCGKVLNRLADGAWVGAYAQRDTLSLKIGRIYSSRHTVRALVRSFVSDKPEAQEHFWRSDLGEPFLPKGEQVTRDLIMNRRGSNTMRDSGSGCTMGIDIGTRIHYMVSKRDEGRRVTVKAGSVANFAQIHSVMKRFGVVKCVIDALPETRKAKDFAQKYPKGTVFLAYYKERDADRSLVTLDSRRIEETDRRETAIATITRTYAMDCAVSDLESGKHVLPKDIEKEPEFIPHMEGSKRIMMKDVKSGNLKPVWVKVKDDHFFHANVYDHVAWTMLEPRRRARVKAAVITRG